MKNNIEATKGVVLRIIIERFGVLMGNFFNMNNGVFAFLGKLFDLIFLNIIWVIFCIPIITIGPANTALYYTTVKVIRRERGYVFREFFKSFRLNFKRGTIVGIVLTLLSLVLFFDLSWANHAEFANNTQRTILYGVFVALSSLLFFVSVYVFPVLSRFDMTIKQLCKASALMAVKHLLTTILIAATTIAAVLLVLFNVLFIFVIPGLVTLCNSFLMERVLKKYMPQSSGDPEDTGKDEWYLE